MRHAPSGRGDHVGRRRVLHVTEHVSYISTDADLPPVAIIDRSPITTTHKIIFGVIAVIGAVAWSVVAFARGETVNAVWIVVAAICTYVIGFRFYARLIETKVVRPRDDHATPAEVLENASDYLPTDRRVVFGHHFAAIAGAGPLTGPVLATQMGYLPSSIWIVVGAVGGRCRTTSCCGSPPGGAAVRWARWPERSSASSAGTRRSSALSSS